MKLSLLLLGLFLVLTSINGLKVDP